MNNHKSKTKTIKLRCITLAAIFCCLYTTHHCFAQNPHLDGSQFKEGLLELKFKDSWKYQPGDNLDWAKPDFDDSKWFNLDPIGLKANNMPDSLWKGYGWWRFRFTSDQQVVDMTKRLYFYTYGAADIFLDGKLVQSYGKFSKDLKSERTYISNYSADRPLIISSQKEHVLAVRFSNHQAKPDYQLFRKIASDLGFEIGLATAARGVYSDGRYANSLARISVIGALLILLIFLHLMLFFKFRRDNANLLISVITILFFFAALAAHISLFIQVNGFFNSIIGNIANSNVFALGFSFIPYALTLILRIDNFSWVKNLFLLVIIRMANYYFQLIPFVLFDGVILLLTIAFIVFLMVKANKNKGVLYVTFGAIGTAFFLLLNRLNNANLIHLSNEMNYLDIVLLYICFPLGIYIYNTNQYGSLFNSMEQEVANRTSELNLSIENLKKSQSDLAKKNAENELLLKEIHHRVKNNLEVVSSLLALQSEKTNDPEIQNAMLASQNRVLSMGILHQKLYQSEHLAFIEMKNYFIHLTENILDSYNAVERVEMEFDMEKMELDIDTAVPVGLIVNELITNALKYAFSVGQIGKIRLRLEKISEKLLQLTISDNGIGKPLESGSIGTGFGTQLVQLLTKQLEGTLTQSTDQGTTISIQFKGQIMT